MLDKNFKFKGIFFENCFFTWSILRLGVPIIVASQFINKQFYLITADQSYLEKRSNHIDSDRILFKPYSNFGLLRVWVLNHIFGSDLN